MLTICDRLIVIDGGRILADGPRDEVLGRLDRRDAEGSRAMTVAALRST